jgi:hypothetical protein
MKQPDNEYELHLRPRPSKTVSIEIPEESLESLEKVAAGKDMSLQALIRFYVGQGLRTDLSRIYGDHLLERAARVLTRHLQSQEEVSAILREIEAVDA